MLRNLNKKVFYPYPLQRVWQVLTNQKALAAWLMENNFEARLGHKFQFIYSSLPGMNAHINCEVIELDEPRRLSFTWKDNLMYQPSIVTWTLEAVNGGTILKLEHRILESAYKQEQKVHQDWQTNKSIPSASLTKQLGVSTLTSPNYYGLTNNSFEQSTSIIMSAYFNGGWEDKLNQNLLQALEKELIL